MDNIGKERELQLANVANGYRVGAARSLKHTRERAQLAILGIHTHFDRGVVRCIPELDVGVKRATLGAEEDLDLVNRRRAITPSS
jgi:hypothetical protein